MIVAALESLEKQTGQPARLHQALAWLVAHQADVDLNDRVEIDGKEIYALVQVYETIRSTELVKLEAHKSYIDVQYIVSGEEMMGWAPKDAMRDVTSYNPDKDVYHGLAERASLTPVIVRAGHAAIFYPEDAHAPKLAVGAPVAVRKIVLKVRID
jgi:biofilm protein TabA